MSKDEKQDAILHPKVVEDILVWIHSTSSTSDSVSKLLRLHALTEHYLDRLLALHLRDADIVLDDGRFSYHHKRLLVAALGALPPNITESLKRLTALRNKCAHSAHPMIKDSEVRYSAEPINEAFEAAHADSSNDGLQLDDLGAYAWALFSEITLRITPREIFLTGLSQE